MNAYVKSVVRTMLLSAMVCLRATAGPEPTGGGIGGTGHPAYQPLETTSDQPGNGCNEPMVIGKLFRQSAGKHEDLPPEILCGRRTVVTSAGQSATLVLASDDRLELDENTELTVSVGPIEHGRPPRTVILQRGGLLARNEGTSTGSGIQITGRFGAVTLTVGEVRIRVTPTLQPHRAKSELARIHVISGSTRLSTEHDEQVVGEGQTAVVIGDESYALIRILGSRLRSKH